MNMPHALRRMAPWGILLPLSLVIAQVVVSFDRLKMVMLGILPLLLTMTLNVEVGVYVLLTFSTVVVFLKRLMPNLDSNQIGVLLEGMLLLMGARMILELALKRQFGVLRTPLTWPALIFAGYQVLEVFNPLAPSLLFGVSGLRDALRMLGMGLMIVFFRSKSQLQRFALVWLGLIFLESLYGIFQHHHGLLNQEYLWLIDSGSWRTHILDGYVRVFGTVGDAATFGFLEATGVLMLFGLALVARGWKLLALLLTCLPMLYAMVLSYSRGPIVALAAGLAFMLILSRNWKLSVGVGLVMAMGMGGLSAMGQHSLMDRVITAAKPSEDASFNVRMGYLNDYWPRIVERPFGSGLWTAGASGLGLTGGRALAGTTIGLPTDNNYFKFALEMGWVGLALFLWLLLTALVSLIRTYSRLADPFLKALSLGLGGVLAGYLVGAVSNDIFVQKPLSEWLYLALGLAMLLGQYRESAR